MNVFKEVYIMNKLLIYCVSLVVVVSFQDVQAQQHEFGKVVFDVSCSETVQDDFDRALAMLHNMMYATAREDFEEIAEADPNCAMAYWGIATTLFQPLWGTRPTEEDLHLGRRIIKKAHDLVESEREHYLIESTAEFFREPESADFWTRIRRWAEVMESAYEVYPADPDIAAFYGLSRLAIAQVADDRYPLHDEAEVVLRDIHEKIPTHPGAIHYSIHATDVDGRAGNALEMVKGYGKIAPDVPHALHMPTHIYVRLGEWLEVIDWNRKSAEAALNHSVDGALSHHYLHAVDYLVYAYLQLGDDKKAQSIMDEAWEKDSYQKSFVAAYHMAAVPARMVVERKDWVNASNLEPQTPDYLPWNASPWAEGLTWLARGLGAVHTGNLENALDAEQKLHELKDRAKANGSEDMATYIEIDRLVLAGRIAHALGEDEEAVELLRSAAELERQTEKHPVTPGALLPPNEALGDLLMELDRPGEALEAYEESDAIWPERYNTLMGAARAARAAGEKSTAQKYYEKLLANAKESSRPGINEAQGFIAGQ